MHSGICKNCGVEYLRPRPLRSEFCSRSCARRINNPIEIRNCLTCNTIFETPHTSTKKYCSLLCNNRRSRGKSKKWRDCLQCGKEFLYKVKTQKCCSFTCAGLFSRKPPLEKICPECNQLFIAYKHKNKICCSYRCAGKYRFKINNPNKIAFSKEGYRTFKQKLIDTYSGCMLCQYNEHPEILELHHINRNRKDNRPENLILLCPNCHSWDHFIGKDGQFSNNLGRLNKINVSLDSTLLN
jgi:hypothetical protein